MSKWLVILLLFVSMKAQLSISDYLENIVLNNPTIIAAHLSYEKEAKKYYINTLPERPEISWENNEILEGNSISTANEKTISISQEIKFPVVYFYNHKIANTDIKIAYQGYLEAGIKTLLAAKKAANKFIILKKKDALLSEFIDRYSIVLKQTEQLKKAGEISEMNLLRISLEYESLLNDRRTFKKDLASQKEILKSFYPDFKDLSLDSIIINDKLIKLDLREHLYNNLPSMQRSKLLESNSDFKLTREYYNRFPNFSFSYLNQSINKINYNGFKLSLSIPLWIPKEVESVQVQTIQSDIFKYKSKTNNLLTERFIENGWTVYQSELDNWNRYISSILPKTERVFTIAQKQYNAGETSYFEFIDNYRLWKNALISELDHRLSLLQIIAELQQTDLIKYLKKEIN